MKKPPVLRAIRTGTSHFRRDLQAAYAQALLQRGDTSGAIAILQENPPRPSRELADALIEILKARKVTAKRGHPPKGPLRNDEWGPLLRKQLREGVSLRVKAGERRDDVLEDLAVKFRTSFGALQEFLYPRRPRKRKRV